MKTKLIFTIAAGILILTGAVGAYRWFLCRVYVPSGHMAVVTAKTGSDPKPGEILVGPGEKGIREEVLAEGRYFFDPFLYDVRICKAIDIPLGKVGVVTSKIGKPLPPGEIIAPDKESQGIWKNVLGPGLYRLNPQGYHVEILDAINIPVGYIGVVTSQTGKPAPAGKFAGNGEKGVLKDILQPGLYYLNPRAYQVNVIEIGMNQVTMSGKTGSMVDIKKQIRSASSALSEISNNTLNRQAAARNSYLAKSSSFLSSVSKKIAPPSTFSNESDRIMPAFKSKAAAGKREKAMSDGVYSIGSVVEFPSRDGFKIMIDMTVEFELLPDNVSKVYMLYGDLPQVVEKIILPQILSVSRMKGSTYKAQDFIMGEGRETFQNNLRAELVKTLKEKNIIIHNAIIRNVSIPENILRPIQDSSLAKEQNLTNLSLQETAKIEATLNTHLAMIEQKRLEVQQETRKLVAETQAAENNAVRMIDAETELEIAKINLKKAQTEAETRRLLGETGVRTKFMVENEKALGTGMKSAIFGTPGVLADLKLVENLGNRLEIRILHSGTGTLWTDLKSGVLPLKK